LLPGGPYRTLSKTIRDKELQASIAERSGGQPLCVYLLGSWKGTERGPMRIWIRRLLPGGPHLGVIKLNNKELQTPIIQGSGGKYAGSCWRCLEETERSPLRIGIACLLPRCPNL